MAIPNYSIRQMRQEEIPAVLDLGREANNYLAIFSLHTFYDYDPEGFFVAVTDEGTVIGSCAGVKQNEDVYFMGLYAVKATFRGMGIGLKLWEAVRNRIGEDKNIAVNSVPKQLANYRERSGLPTQVNWTTYYYILPRVDFSLFRTTPQDVCLKRLHRDDEANLELIQDFDEKLYGYSRGRLVKLSCTQPESVTVVALDRDAQVCGYGTISENVKSRALVGPLYADSVDVAEAILRRLIADFPLAQEKGVTFMLFDKNSDAVDMIKRLGFELADPQLVRLYRKGEVHVDYGKVFSQHNLCFSLF